jgi:UDP-glucose 4-epimerase
MPTTDLSGQRVLVTGGTGFIGRHLVDSLADAALVRVLDREASSSELPEHATLVHGDIRDMDTCMDAMEGIDTVFHLAAMVSVPRSIEAPLECHADNGTGTVQVLEAARQVDARVVLASSAAIYGHPESVPVTERAPTTPSSPYGVEKLANDHYARIYGAQYGLQTTALRYFNVYGPGQTGQYSGVISAFFDQVRAQEPITVEGDGSQTRDFVHVEDVVQANRLAATRDTADVAFNIGTGRSISIRDLAELIRELADIDVPITHVDPRPGDIQQSEADISRAAAQLGYAPTVDLADGLRDMFDRGQ